MEKKKTTFFRSDILDNGIEGKDMPLIKAWGYYLGLDDKMLTNADKFYKSQIDYVNEYDFTIESVVKLSTSQLRKFFGAVKKIQASDFSVRKNEIILLNPKLAYAVGRDLKKERNKSGKEELKNKSKIKRLYDLFHPIIDRINEDEKRFKVFVNLFEAIVAYHKEVSAETN